MVSWFSTFLMKQNVKKNREIFLPFSSSCFGFIKTDIINYDLWLKTQWRTYAWPIISGVSLATQQKKNIMECFGGQTVTNTILFLPDTLSCCTISKYFVVAVRLFYVALDVQLSEQPSTYENIIFHTTKTLNWLASVLSTNEWSGPLIIFNICICVYLS